MSLGERSPGTGRNALPCSPRHSDSFHIQCIAGGQRSQVRRKCLGAVHQCSTQPAGRFPNVSASSPPTLSSVIFPQPACHPLVALLQGAATSPRYRGLDVRVVSSPASSLLPPQAVSLQSCPTSPPGSALHPPPCPRVCKCSSGLTLPLLDHCPSLLPSLLASSLPLRWPQKCLCSLRTVPNSPLLMTLPRHPRALEQSLGTAWWVDLAFGHTLQKEQ